MRSTSCSWWELTITVRCGSRTTSSTLRSSERRPARSSPVAGSSRTSTRGRKAIASTSRMRVP